MPGEDRVLGLGYVRDEDAVDDREIAIVDGDRRFRAIILGPAR